MKRIYLILLVLFLLALNTPAWGDNYCPVDTFDRGICDTMYVDPWNVDTLLQGDGPYFIRVPIYATADIAPPDTQYGPHSCDSINAFVIPLCYTHTNPTKYCSLSGFWNQISWVPSKFYRSIFRHMPNMTNPQVHNWMMDQFEEGNGEEWNQITLDLDGNSHFWLMLFPSGTEDQWFGSGSRILLATMTFKVQDTMTICMDSCFWPPSSNLAWGTYYFYLGQTKIPRLGTPHDPASYKVSFNLHRSPFLCGDANGDGSINIGDIVYLINYQFKNGPAPIPLQAGDVNDDGVVDIGDIIYLINYLFKGGPPPCA